MPLPQLPMLNEVALATDSEKIKQNKDNIERLYGFLQDVLDGFENAVGEAIDPTEGGGGDGSITIEEAPTDIVYTPGSGLSVDGNIFGHIDISYSKPRFAVSVAIRYRQVGVTNFRVTHDQDSPFRISNLKVGEDYELQMAGRSANGALGPFSSLETVVIPTSGSFAKAPADAQYLVAALDSRLTAERLVVDSPTVTWDFSTDGQASATAIESFGIDRVIEVSETRVLADQYSVVVSTYFMVNGTLELQGDAVVEII